MFESNEVAPTTHHATTRPYIYRVYTHVPSGRLYILLGPVRIYSGLALPFA